MKSHGGLIVGAISLLSVGLSEAAGLAAEGLARNTPLESQLSSARDATAGNRVASSLARTAGNNSIGKGTLTMNLGKSHHAHPEINLGAFEIAQGLLGLMASAEAEKLGNQDSNIATGLDAISSDSHMSTAEVVSTSGASIGGAAASTNGVAGNSVATKISPQDLSNPETKQALAQIQEQFGYTPEQLVDSLSKGVNASTLFTHAPLNPLTPAEAEAAMAALSDSSAGEGAPALSASTLATSAAPPSPPITNTASEPAKVAANSLLRDKLRDALARRLASISSGENNIDVSPDVKAALEAKAAAEAEQAKREAASRAGEYDLFQVVHLKYLEREKMLRF